MEPPEFLRHILAALNENTISYCVLRNYDFLLEGRRPRKASERSIDISVSTADINEFDRVMKGLGFSLRKPQFSRRHRAYFLIHELTPISFDVQVGGIYWNDVQYLDEDIFRKRVKKGFFFVLGNEDLFVMLLFHSLLGKRYFKPEYQQLLLNLKGRVDPDFVRTKISRVLPRQAREITSLAFLGEWDTLSARKYRYITSFIFSSARNAGIFFLLFLRWLKWKRFLGSAPLISVIGPDGAGKSTLVQSLADYLKQNHREVQMVYTGRGRGQILPFAALGRKYKQKEKQRDSRNASIISWKRKLWYTSAAPIFALDLWLRYLFQILPLRKRGKIVITDRYCTDILLMKHVPVWFTQFLFWLFPTPTLTFYVYNSAEVLHQRREEESIEELNRQMALFGSMVTRLNAISIKTDDKELVRQKVYGDVMRYLYREWY